MKISIPDALTRSVKMEVPIEQVLESLSWFVCVPINAEYTIYLYEDEMWGSDATHAVRFDSFGDASKEALRFQEKALSEGKLKPYYGNATVILQPVQLDLGGAQ